VSRMIVQCHQSCSLGRSPGKLWWLQRPQLSRSPWGKFDRYCQFLQFCRSLRHSLTGDNSAVQQASGCVSTWGSVDGLVFDTCGLQLRLMKGRVG
jgi:hypothetical protein